jgi:hypothetical protein
MKRKPSDRTIPAGKRRGIAVLLILGMLAMTLAMSYATLRTQATTAQQTSNLIRGDEARLAAESGMQSALRTISGSSWGGVDSVLTANVTSNSSYRVTFTTGDSELTAASPSYGDFPYRLTILSTGTATDPARPAIQAQYRIQAVVQLARRELNPLPGGWSLLDTISVYQWANREVYAQLPMRVQGLTVLNGEVNLCDDYPPSSSTRERYLEDLNAMRLAGLGDFRPFNGPLALPYSRQDSATLNALQSDLGITTINTTATNNTSAPAYLIGSISTYRLYPGGKAYKPPVLQTAYGSTLTNVTIAPDPATNPLGLLRSTGDLTICNNVNITGTILSENASDIQICGTQVTLAAPNLPLLEDSSQVWQLPVLIATDDMRVLAECQVGIQGQTIVFDEFEIKSGSQNSQFLLDGQLLTASLAVRGRSDWSTSLVHWAARYTAFLAQVGLPGGVKHFPTWMKNHSGFNPEPTLTIQRNSSGVKYHWHDWSQAVFQKDPADAGLRWNLIRWSEDV